LGGGEGRFFHKDTFIESAPDHVSIDDHKHLRLPSFEYPDRIAYLQREFTKGDMTTMSLKVKLSTYFHINFTVIVERKYRMTHLKVGRITHQEEMLEVFSPHI
jgi:hypothetical protein